MLNTMDFVFSVECREIDEIYISMSICVGTISIGLECKETYRCCFINFFVVV